MSRATDPIGTGGAGFSGTEHPHHRGRLSILLPTVWWRRRQCITHISNRGATNHKIPSGHVSLQPARNRVVSRMQWGCVWVRQTLLERRTSNAERRTPDDCRSSTSSVQPFIRKKTPMKSSFLYEKSDASLR